MRRRTRSRSRSRSVGSRSRNRNRVRPQNGQSTREIICNTRRDKIYCGSKCYLPDDSYTRFGSPWECMQKGMMVGKLQSRNEDLLAQLQRLNNRNRNNNTNINTNTDTTNEEYQRTVARAAPVSSHQQQLHQPAASQPPMFTPTPLRNPSFSPL